MIEKFELKLPDERHALRIVSGIITLKLLLFSILLPVCIAFSKMFASRLNEINQSRNDDSAYGEFCAFVIFFGGISIFVLYLLDEAEWPLSLLFLMVGFLVDVMIVTPRLFLGYLLDLFVLRQDIESGPVIFSRVYTVVLAIIVGATVLLGHFCVSRIASWSQNL